MLAFGRFSEWGSSVSISRPSARMSATSDISRFPCWMQMLEINWWLIEVLGFDLDKWTDLLLGCSSLADVEGMHFLVALWLPSHFQISLPPLLQHYTFLVIPLHPSHSYMSWNGMCQSLSDGKMSTLKNIGKCALVTHLSQRKIISNKFIDAL